MSRSRTKGDRRRHGQKTDLRGYDSSARIRRALNRVDHLILLVMQTSRIDVALEANRPDRIESDKITCDNSPHGAYS
jgi:hypothetical protein